MSGHTKGRLRADRLVIYAIQSGNLVAEYVPENRDEWEANAARLVACWNACEGMADPEAEVGRMRAQMAEAIAILENGTDYEKMHVVEILRDGLGGSDV